MPALKTRVTVTTLTNHKSAVLKQFPMCSKITLMNEDRSPILDSSLIHEYF